jgi:hypothetical protein
MPRGGVTFRFTFRSGFPFHLLIRPNPQYRPNSLQIRTIRQAQKRPTKSNHEVARACLSTSREVSAARNTWREKPATSGSLRACDPPMHLISSTIHEHQRGGPMRAYASTPASRPMRRISRPHSLPSTNGWRRSARCSRTGGSSPTTKTALPAPSSTGPARASQGPTRNPHRRPAHNSRAEVLPTYRVGAPVVCAPTSSVEPTEVNANHCARLPGGRMSLEDAA